MLRMQVSDNGPMLGPTRLNIEPDGLTIERTLMTTHFKWAAIKGVEIVKNAVVLPIDHGMGIIVPASTFASDAERFDFAATISKRLEDHAAKG